jgi:hypothetical protein
MPAADRRKGLIPLQVDHHSLAGRNRNALQGVAAAEILRCPRADAAGKRRRDGIEGVLVEVTALVARRGEVGNPLAPLHPRWPFG